MSKVMSFTPQQKRSNKYRSLCYLLLFLSIYPSSIFSNTFENESVEIFFWSQNSNSDTKNGCYGYNRVDSSTESSKTNLLFSSFWLDNNTSWKENFPEYYVKMNSTILKQKPAAVIRSSDNFSECEWFTGFKRSDSDDSICFYFPVLPTSKSYGQYDFFTIEINNDCNLEFYSIDEKFMVGSFVNKNLDEDGTIKIIARNVFLIEHTSTNQFRIKSIQCNGAFDSLVTLYLGYNLNTIKEGEAWYGIDITNTVSNPPIIEVHSVSIEGESPYIAGSNHTISWSLGSPQNVDSCLLFISYNNQKDWYSAGKTGVDSTIIWTVPSHSTDKAHIKITAYGKSGESTSAVSQLFSIKVPQKFSLEVQSYAKNAVIAHWNPESFQPDIESFWIAYGFEHIVTTLSAGDSNTIHYSLLDSCDTITGLDNTGMYYFTAFVQDTSGSIYKCDYNAIDSALAEDLTPPENNYELDTIKVDSTWVILSWNPGKDINKDIDSIAVWYNKSNFPNPDDVSSSIHIRTWKAGEGIDTVTKLSPDKLYYFSLFAVDEAGNWSDAPGPAKIKMRTLPVAEDQINGIPFTLNTEDTVSVLSNSVKIWSSTLDASYTDTIEEWTAPSMEGFISQGPAFTFRKGTLPSDKSLNFNITKTSPKTPYSDSDILLYRFNIENGKWYRDTAHMDKNNNQIVFSSNQIYMPFILMIDTISPKLSLHRKDTSAQIAGKSIEGIFTVSDNIENPSVKLLAGSGASGYTDFFNSYIDTLSSANTYRFTIPAYAVNGISGLRGMIITNDGRNSDSIRISQKIIRTGKNCDDTLTSSLQWEPIRVSASPININSMEDLMAEALDVDEFSYNNTRQAIAQWLPMESNESTPGNKWVEYSKKYKKYFPIELGKLYWIRTDFRIPLLYGDAIIPALIDTFSITLKPGEWTDFSIPFNFNIFAGDIINATGNTDDLQLHEWYPDSASKSYVTKPVYIEGIDTLSNTDYILKANGAFTAKNNGDEDIVLRIPPTTVSTSTIPNNSGLQKKSTHNRQWCVKIAFSGQNSGKFQTTYIAQKPSDNKPIWVSTAPSFSAFSAAIINPDDNKKYGLTASGDLNDGGDIYKVQFSNNSSNSTVIGTAIDFTRYLPADTKVRFYTVDDLSHAKSDTFSLTVPQQQSRSAYLIIGSDSYIHSTVTGLNTRFTFQPVTFKNICKINYTLPADVQRFCVTIFDLKGRQLTSITRDSDLHPGNGTLFINRYNAPGYYIVQMRIFTRNGSQPRTLNKRWMYVQ